MFYFIVIYNNKLVKAQTIRKGGECLVDLEFGFGRSGVAAVGARLVGQQEQGDHRQPGRKEC